MCGDAVRHTSGTRLQVHGRASGRRSLAGGVTRGGGALDQVVARQLRANPIDSLLHLLMHSRPRDAETHPRRTWEALSLLQTGLQGACRKGLDSSGALAIALAACAERGAAPESRVWITCAEKGHLAAAGHDSRAPTER